MDTSRDGILYAGTQPYPCPSIPGLPSYTKPSQVHPGITYCMQVDKDGLCERCEICTSALAVIDGLGMLLILKFAKSTHL